MRFKLLHTKQLYTALKTTTSSRSRSIFSSNSWWEMCSSGNRTRSVRPDGKYCSIQHTKISEIQTGIFGQMERAPCFLKEVENIFPVFLSSYRNTRKSCENTYLRLVFPQHFSLSQTSTRVSITRYSLPLNFLGFLLV